MLVDGRLVHVSGILAIVSAKMKREVVCRGSAGFSLKSRIFSRHLRKQETRGVFRCGARNSMYERRDVLAHRSEGTKGSMVWRGASDESPLHMCLHQCRVLLGCR